MRAAPAVCVPIGLSTGWQAVQSLTWALAASALAAWWLARGGGSPARGLAVALPVGLVAWRCLRTDAAEFRWDGAQWLLDGSAVRVTVALDLDRWLLLALRDPAGGSTRWLPATARQAGAQWHLLRAALYSRAPEAPLAAAPPASPQAGATPD